MIIEFNWLEQEGVIRVIEMLNKILGIVRIVVPIILIVMTTVDITKKVIDPNEKDGQKKIMTRAIAALIVFLIPTLINIFLNIAGIKKVELTSNSNSTNIPQKTTAPLSTPVKTPSSVSCLKGEYLPAHSFNCEKCLVNHYCLGGIFKIMNDSKPSGLTYCGDGYTSPVGSTKASDCVKKVTPTEKPTLQELSIINCPKNIQYKIGEKVTLNTSIPSSFNGVIDWQKHDLSDMLSDSKNISIIESKDKKSATFEILGVPSTGSFYITVVAGGKHSSCTLKSYAVDQLEIVNCPSNNQVYHVGDKINLVSNLPTAYYGAISWGNNIDPDHSKITPSADQKSAEVQILKVPNNKQIYIGFAADGKSVSCIINVE